MEKKYQRGTTQWQNIPLVRSNDGSVLRRVVDAPDEVEKDARGPAGTQAVGKSGFPLLDARAHKTLKQDVALYNKNVRRAEDFKDVILLNRFLISKNRKPIA